MTIDILNSPSLERYIYCELSASFHMVFHLSEKILLAGGAPPHRMLFPVPSLRFALDALWERRKSPPTI